MATNKEDKKMIADSTTPWAIRIKKLLDENNMNQVALAVSIKKSEAAVSAMMAGAHPRIPTLKAVADVFDVSLDYLVGLTESRITDDHCKIGRAKFGLEDDAMKFLEPLKEGKEAYEYDRELPIYTNTTLKLINFVIKNISFWKDIEPLLYKYARAKVVESLGEDAYEITEFQHEDGTPVKTPIFASYTYDAGFIRYSISRVLEKFIDDCCDKLHPDVEQMYLDIIEKRRNRSEDDNSEL